MCHASSSSVSILVMMSNLLTLQATFLLYVSRFFFFSFHTDDDEQSPDAAGEAKCFVHTLLERRNLGQGISK